MALAKDLHMEDYPQPAGGCCYLTDPQYAAKLQDVFDHEGKENLTHEHVLMLKVGRHFRISDKIKVIVGRNEKENNFLKAYEKNRHVFRILEHPSAHVLAEIKGDLSAEEAGLLASITVRYSDAPAGSSVAVEHAFGESVETVNAQAIENSRLEAWRM